MRSLRALCNDSGFPKSQQIHFKEEVNALLVQSGVGESGALFCLRRLWQHYDVGGHSMGRSLRSIVLEGVIGLLRTSGETATEIRIEKAKTLLSVLVAMHYDYEYINRHDWFDYQLAGTEDLPFRDRVLVSAAAFALGVDDLPSLDDWNKERIFTFVRDSENG